MLGVEQKYRSNLRKITLSLSALQRHTIIRMEQKVENDEENPNSLF